MLFHDTLFHRPVKKSGSMKENSQLHCKECSLCWNRALLPSFEDISPSFFVCPLCRCKHGQGEMKSRFTSESLLSNTLSDFLEKRVRKLLKTEEMSVGETATGAVRIRVLASSDKTVEVLPWMKALFSKRGAFPESLPYRQKAIFAFQDIEGHDVCFFGMYVQEYGSDCPQPNHRSVYIAYLDSVPYLHPREYRTAVYHEILVGYLQYVQTRGFTTAHVWARPPGRGVDYIFHEHPKHQRIPSAKQLHEWYEAMLEKAKSEGVVVEVKNLLEDATDRDLTSPTQLPYFDDDFWPSMIEGILEASTHPPLSPYLLVSLYSSVFQRFPSVLTIDHFVKMAYSCRGVRLGLVVTTGWITCQCFLWLTKRSLHLAGDFFRTAKLSTLLKVLLFNETFCLLEGSRERTGGQHCRWSLAFNA